MNLNLIKKIRTLRRKIEEEIKNKLKDFKKNFNTSSEQKFLELCFCILVANTSIQKSQEVFRKIGRGFLYLQKDKLKKKLKKAGYRFYNKRTEYIISARRFIKKLNFISKDKNEKELREWLVDNIKGIGWKEASHFLRNLGFKNFAILDRHVLKILDKYKLLDKIPLTLSMKNYLEIEAKLKNIADHLKITPAELDLYLFYLDTERICER